jgi:hypothetical protein
LPKAVLMRLSEYRGLIVIVGGVATSFGCRGTDSTSVVASSRLAGGQELPDPMNNPELPPAAGGSSVGALQEPEAVFPFHWCERTDTDEFDSIDVIGTVSDAYFVDQRRDCRTAGLTASLPRDKNAAWLSYLFNYTNAMTGCPLIYDPPPQGGINAFGPANTPVLGIPRPTLGRDDVALLIEKYSLAFSDALELSDSERAAVEAHLWRTAESEMDPASSNTLSICP